MHRVTSGQSNSVISKCTFLNSSHINPFSSQSTKPIPPQTRNKTIIPIQFHRCQPPWGVDLSPESVNLYFPYAGWDLLFFHWQQRHFEFQPACVAVEGRSNVVLNTHARLQISLPTRFLSLSHQASQCAFGDGVRWLLVQQFFSLFAQFKTTTKSHVNYVFLYPFSSMAISPQNNEKTVFYTGKLYGLTGMLFRQSFC